MKFLDRGQGTSEKSESPSSEMSAALEDAERKIAERDLLLSAALDQTEAARAQYEQANTRAETLRRHLTAKEEQLITLQAVLQQREERISELERQVANNNGFASHESVMSVSPGISIDRLPDLGLALESLDEPGTMYRILRPTTTIGRNAMNDIAINSNSVSRFHARLIVDEDGIFLIDLGSTNGCKVNGKRITREMIGNADAISIGNIKFRFSFGISADVESRGMQETHVLLNDSAIFVPAPKATPHKGQ
jgi:hypothetical protein